MLGRDKRDRVTGEGDRSNSAFHLPMQRIRRKKEMERVLFPFDLLLLLAPQFLVLQLYVEP